MTGSKHRFHFRALSARLTSILFSGLSPQQLLLTCCAGIAVGTLPLVWGSSLLGLLLARRLQLNHLALQSLNYLLYPLQLLLLLPFCSLGARLFPWGPAVPADLHGFLLHGRMTGQLLVALLVTLKALGAWLLIVPPLLGAAYLLVSACRHCPATR